MVMTHYTGPAAGLFPFNFYRRWGTFDASEQLPYDRTEPTEERRCG